MEVRLSIHRADSTCVRTLICPFGGPDASRGLEFSGRLDYHTRCIFQGKPVVLIGPAQTGGLLRKAVRKLGLAVAVTTAVWAMAPAVHARSPVGSVAAASVALGALPDEAQRTYRLIQVGGPFPYPKDGIVFGNRERQLPAKARGYYREYTVKTPGARDRGARRIVCGGTAPASPEACYYTADHYTSFRHIVE